MVLNAMYVAVKPLGFGLSTNKLSPRAIVIVTAMKFTADWSSSLTYSSMSNGISKYEAALSIRYTDMHEITITIFKDNTSIGLSSFLSVFSFDA